MAAPQASGRVAQWIRRRSTEPKIPGSIPGVVILLLSLGRSMGVHCHVSDNDHHQNRQNLCFFEVTGSIQQISRSSRNVTVKNTSLC